MLGTLSDILNKNNFKIDDTFIRSNTFTSNYTHSSVSVCVSLMCIKTNNIVLYLKCVFAMFLVFKYFNIEIQFSLSLKTI